MDANQNSGGAAAARAKNAPPAPAGVSQTEALEELARILKSAEFEHSDRSRPLLQYLVEAAVSGRENELKESIIALQVFSRDATYNPKVDPVVRVTVGRLRNKLEKYFQREGDRDLIRIAIPKGSYVPVFERVAALPIMDTPPAQPVQTGRRGAFIAAWALGVVTLILAAWALRRPHVPALDHLRPFQSSGTPYRPAFSPGGNILAFDAEAAGDGHRNVFLQRLDATSPTRVGDGTANELSPAWSADGSQLGYLRDLSSDTWGVFIVPVVGGTPRKVAELRKGATPWLAWSPDGRWLAGAEPSGGNPPGLVLISPTSGERHILTRPPAGWHGDSLPAFSADSRTIAFRRTGALSGNEDIYSVPVTGGTVTRLTFDDRGISGLALLRDGSLLVTSKRAGSIRSLWWQRKNERNLERITPATLDAGMISVSRDGDHFALVPYFLDVNIWSIASDGSGAARTLIESELSNSSPQYSPDGRRVAFHSVRTGTAGIWVSDAAGGNAVQLVDGKGFEIGNEQWSPDGRRIVFEWHTSGKSALYTVASDGGAPRALLADAYNNAAPAWSRDGAYVYFTSDRSGNSQIWRMDAAGGAPSVVVQTPSTFAKLAADGSALYYASVHAGDTREILRQPLQNGLPAGAPEQVLTGLAPLDHAVWAVTQSGLYYLHRERGHPTEIQFFEFANHRVRTVWQLQKAPAPGGGLAVSPDGKTILFTQTDRDGSAIYVQ